MTDHSSVIFVHITNLLNRKNNHPDNQNESGNVEYYNLKS